MPNMNHQLHQQVATCPATEQKSRTTVANTTTNNEPNAKADADSRHITRPFKTPQPPNAGDYQTLFATGNKHLLPQITNTTHAGDTVDKNILPHHTFLELLPTYNERSPDRHPPIRFEHQELPDQDRHFLGTRTVLPNKTHQDPVNLKEQEPATPSPLASPHRLLGPRASQHRLLGQRAEEAQNCV